jgi:DMSO/TMAO reductase YedYZ molybdopterin-dependent catalytic subunit
VDGGTTDGSRRPPGTVMSPSGTVKRQRPPDALGAAVTAVEDLYVIGHFGIAQVDPATWRLHVEGRVARPLELDLDALRSMPSVTEQAVLECFGNPLRPAEPTRRVGNVVWRGTPVAAVLELAGAHDAGLVWAEGHDSGVFEGTACGEYLKDLPLDVVRERGLLAYEMNGGPLTVEHGHPVRLFVPGYFGTNNVKWLRRLTVADDRPEHLFTTVLYQRPVPGAGLAPVRDLDVNSLVTDVRDSGSTLLVTGWSWGSSTVVDVEVGVQDAEGAHEPVRAVLSPPVGGAFSWRRFSAEVARTPGARAVWARARDASGARQPTSGARNARHVVDLGVG